MACRNGSLAGNLGERRCTAVDNVGDRFAVRVNCVALLRGKVPSAQGESYNKCGKLHVGWLRANLNAISERDESGALLLPFCAIGTIAMPPEPRLVLLIQE